MNHFRPFEFRKMKLYFKGGSDSYDAAFNARMATIAEAQQGMAEESFDFWRSDYKPMEQAQIGANLELIPSETELNLAQNQSNLSLIPEQTELASAQIGDTMTGIGERAPVREKFYQESLTGVDVEGRASRAGADASQSFANANSIMRRNTARMGINPTSGRFADMQNTNALNRAKTVASAQTTARTGAEQENYGRLANAMNYGG